MTSVALIFKRRHPRAVEAAARVVSLLETRGVRVLLTTAQQQALATLVLAEMAHAPTQPLGVPMPDPQHGDRRLRALCEAVMNAPAMHATLAAWAAHSGASERTLAFFGKHLA